MMLRSQSLRPNGTAYKHNQKRSKINSITSHYSCVRFRLAGLFPESSCQNSLSSMKVVLKRLFFRLTYAGKNVLNRKSEPLYLNRRNSVILYQNSVWKKYRSVKIMSSTANISLSGNSTNSISSVFNTTLTLESTTTSAVGSTATTTMMATGNFLSTFQVKNSTTIATTMTLVYKRPFTTTHAILVGVTLLLLLVCGIAFNLVTVLVIRSTPKLKNVFMQLIVSLCISDMISAVFSPLFWYRRTLGFDVWEMPTFFCKLYWGVELMTSYVTSLHIVSFAVLRFISIQFPRAYNTVTERKANIWIFLLWLIGFLCGFIPLALLFGPETRKRDSNNEDSRWPACTVMLDKLDIFKQYQKIVYPMFFYAPIIIVTLFSCFIGFVVHARAGNIPGLSVQSTKKRKRKEFQAFVQLFLIVLCFLFGYLPFTAYQFWASEQHPNTRYYQLFDYWFGIAEYLCLRISECLNPIFYNLASSKMRHYTKRYIKENIPSLMIFYKCRRKTPETPSRSSTSLRNSNSGGKILEMADLGV